MQKLSILRFSPNRFTIQLSIAVLLLILSLLCGISFGSVTIPFSEIVQILFAFITGQSITEIPSSTISIVTNIRLPRVILAALVGASLAIAGAAFQGLLQNPLADPYTLGISSGASLGAVLTIFLQLSLPFISFLTLPIMSILCSFLTIFLVIQFTQLLDRQMKVESLILTGIIISSFLGSIISLIISLTGEELRQIIGWLLGSVGMRGWSHIGVLIPFLSIGLIILLLSSRELDIISFGEDRARHLGVNVKRKNGWYLVGSSIVTGAAVAVSGTIGFVGLVIPHFVRLLFGPTHSRLLPLSFIYGASFLIWADLCARTIIQPSELPIGVLTSLIGAPVFGLLLVQRKRERRGSV
ncbi:corrinoid ABC transporter permease [Bacillus coahuilensis m2-6]|uniref:FecCD family ABC transporter permease n=1 Tax=Bacillus coahuilensis TaxID=408580 RepID=UPI0007504AB8|nr:iron ABC transporter permease [Bacillus coahuilensis]KUP08129.1 corrinoid ABC transporter permease [Bacillus coahuilensis m2-6]